MEDGLFAYLTELYTRARAEQIVDLVTPALPEVERLLLEQREDLADVQRHAGTNIVAKCLAVLAQGYEGNTWGAYPTSNLTVTRLTGDRYSQRMADLAVTGLRARRLVHLFGWINYDAADGTFISPYNVEAKTATEIASLYRDDEDCLPMQGDTVDVYVLISGGCLEIILPPTDVPQNMALWQAYLAVSEIKAAAAYEAILREALRMARQHSGERRINEIIAEAD